MMNKLGNFKGVPVYQISYGEWSDKDTKYDKAMYVVDGVVVFHDEQVGIIDDWGRLSNFVEDRFYALYDNPPKRPVAKFEYAEAPVEEAVVASEEDVSAPAASEDFDIDKFLKEGLFDVDGYIQNMMAADLSVEVPDVAVG